MIVEILILVIGIIITLGLAELIIRNSIQLAKHYGLSGTFIGLTILSIGTSIPEIMTHIVGSIEIFRFPEKLNTLSGLLIGTNVGSDIFQQNFVLALVGILGTVVVVKKKLNIEVGALVASSFLLWVLALGGRLTRWDGLLLLLAYAGYLVYLKKSKVSEEFKAANHLSKRETWLSFLLLGIGFVIMGFVSERVLHASISLVESFNISASFFGVVLLGVATALPELTTSVMAVVKKKQDISAGILIGSNITNPLFGLGLGALISTYTVPDVVVFYDLPFKIVTAFLLYYYLWQKEDMDKKEAVTLMILFFFYVIIRSQLFPVDF